MIFFKNNGELQGISFLDNFDFLRTQQTPPTKKSPPTLTQDKEYIYPDFRALSKGLARKRTANGMIVLDFSEGDILETAAPLYPGVGIYPNHMHDIERWKGIILSAVWSNESTEDFPIPGINVKTKIWKGVDPLGHVICPDDYKTTKGIIDGVITRVSTGVVHAFKQSHPLQPHEFFRAMGTVIDGQEVRMIIQRILSIVELSLVLFGADEYAKRLSSELLSHSIKQKDILASVYDNHIETYTQPHRRFWKHSQHSFLKTLAAPNSPNIEDTTKKDMGSLDTALDFMCQENQKLHQEISDLQENADECLAQALTNKDTRISTLEQRVSQLSTKNQSLSDTVESQQETMAQLETLADSGRAYHRKIRENAIHAFRLMCDSQIHQIPHDQQTQTIQLIKTAPIDMVEKMGITFTSKALTVIPRNRVSKAIDPSQQPSFFEMSSEYRRNFASRLPKGQSHMLL